MEIPQLCKSTYNNQLAQSISLRLPRYVRIYIIGQIKAGFKISADPPVHNQPKCYQVEKIKILPVCLS